MKQIFGEFIEEFPPEYDSLELKIKSSDRSLKQGWRNYRLSAYFLADYFSNLLTIAENEPDKEQRLQEVKSTVSYVGNELLENAIKFHENPQQSPVKFGIHFLGELEKITAVIFTENSMSTQKAEQFQAWIEKLLVSDTHELYIQQIEETAADEESEASGIGLLIIINDYSAKLGWKFESEPSTPQITIVTTMAQICI